jgi:hypothetical protein
MGLLVLSAFCRWQAMIGSGRHSREGQHIMMAPNTVAGGRVPSWRTLALRWMGLSLAIALVLQSALWLMWSYAGEWMRAATGDWLFDLYLPAVVVAIYLSGNPHDFNEWVAFVAEVLQTSLVVFVLAMMTMTVRYLYRCGRRSHS